MTWGTPMQSFVFLGLLVFELEPMYATSDRQTDGQTDGRTDGRTTDADDRLMPPPPLRGRRHKNCFTKFSMLPPHYKEQRFPPLLQLPYEIKKSKTVTKFSR